MADARPLPRLRAVAIRATTAAVLLALAGSLTAPTMAAAARTSVEFTSPESTLLIGSSLRVAWTESAPPSAPIVSRRLVTHSAVPDQGACATATYAAEPATTTGPARHLAIDDLVAGRCYYWTITVRDVKGGSATARSVTVRVGATDPMAAFTFPAPGAVTDGPSGPYTVTWSEHASTAIGTRMITEQAAAAARDRSCDGVTWRTTRVFTPSATSLAVGSLGGGSIDVCYRYGVTLTDASGKVSWAGSGSLLVTSAPPPCAYGDVATTRPSYLRWADTFLDTTYRVSATYRPPDLVRTNGIRGMTSTFIVREVAYPDLKALADAARAAGVPIDLTSAYRSYAGQLATSQFYVRLLGPYEGLLRAARPGHSEHQLGTAIDVRAEKGPPPQDDPDWGVTKTGAWLRDNAWKYGWLLSYPHAASPDITCYQYEPWHYRYVGRSLAASVHASGLTLREYLWRSGSLAPGT
jgi:D-alanyl-D-alanine carboxypeptidase